MRPLLLLLCFWGLSAYSQIEEKTYNSSDSLIDFQNYDSTKIVITIDTINSTFKVDCYNLYSKTEYHNSHKILAFSRVVGEMDGEVYFSFLLSNVEDSAQVKYIIPIDRKSYIFVPLKDDKSIQNYYAVLGRGIKILYIEDN